MEDASNEDLEDEIAKAKQISDMRIMEEMKQRKLHWQAQKDEDFTRGKRKFLTNKERDLVIKTLGDESKKHITFDAIRKAVAENEEFREMFEELVNSEYEGCMVGRKKAEEAIRSSYRTYYRNFLDDHGGYFDEEIMANDSQYNNSESCAKVESSVINETNHSRKDNEHFKEEKLHSQTVNERIASMEEHSLTNTSIDNSTKGSINKAKSALGPTNECYEKLEGTDSNDNFISVDTHWTEHHGILDTEHRDDIRIETPSIIKPVEETNILQKSSEIRNDKEPIVKVVWQPEQHFIRGSRKFLSSSERDLVWRTFKNVGKYTITSEDVKLEVMKRKEFCCMYNSLVSSFYNGVVIGKQKAEHAIKSSFRSQMRKYNPSSSSDLLEAENSEDCNLSDEAATRKSKSKESLKVPDNNGVSKDENNESNLNSECAGSDDIIHNKMVNIRNKNNLPKMDSSQDFKKDNTDLLFDRGQRKFLSDTEKSIVKATFQKEGRKTITITDIRSEVATNEKFRTMFNSIVNSTYNGSLVGRHKAEQAIKASFRSQFRSCNDQTINSVDNSVSSFQKQSLNSMTPLNSQNGVITGNDCETEGVVVSSYMGSDTSSNNNYTSNIENEITCNVEILTDTDIAENGDNPLISNEDDSWLNEKVASLHHLPTYNTAKRNNEVTNQKDLVDSDIGFIRGARKFFSNKERWIIKTTFEKFGKPTITKQEIRDAIETDPTFSKMFLDLLNSKYEGKQISRTKAETAVQSSFRSQFRNSPLNEETLYLGHLNI